MRTEQQIFEDLATLCVSPGYVHALGFLCFKHNFVGFIEELTVRDFLEKHTKDCLIRSEQNTLIGLAIKKPIDYGLPSPDTIQRYLDDTEGLLDELHRAMIAPVFGRLREEGPKCNPFAHGGALREPIFYSGDSAYSFQLRDVAVHKYRDDNGWLRARKGFSIEEARNVVQAFCKLQNQKVADCVEAFKTKHPNEWTLLPGFSLTSAEVADATLMSLETQRARRKAESAEEPRPGGAPSWGAPVG